MSDQKTKDLLIQTLEALKKGTRILKEQITRINRKCDDQEEEIFRLKAVIDLYKKGSLNPEKEVTVEENVDLPIGKSTVVTITDKDRKNLKIQCMEKKKVRDQKVLERQGAYFK